MLHCDYCGKGQDEVFRMIAGPKGHGICSECALICASMVMENMKSNLENNKISFKKMEEYWNV